MYENNAISKVIEDAKQIAKDSNLLEVAMGMGYSFRREGQEYRCREMDSLTVYQKNNQWKWYRHSRGIGGDVINFVCEFGNLDFINALNYITNDYIRLHQDDINYEQKTISVSIPKTIVPEPKKEPFIPPTEARNCQKAFDYLTKVRGIDSRIVGYLINKSFVTQEQGTNNVVFKIYSCFNHTPDRKYVGAEKVGTGSKKFKRTHKNSDGEYGFELCRGTGQYVAFFESSIDMLSFMQLTSNTDKYKNFRFVGMTGLKEKTVLSTIKRYNIPPENVFLGTDNDEAGNKFVEKMNKSYPSMKRLVPIVGKDWNDTLKVKIGMTTVEQLNEKYKKEAQEKALKKENQKTKG